jgi:predicted dehydrogenase
MHRHGLPLDLVDVMLAEFVGGALGVVSGTDNQGSDGGGMVDLQVYCAHGSVDMNVISGRVVIHQRNQAPEISELAESERYPRFATARNLADICLGRAGNGSPVEPGWHTVELLDAAYRSAAEDGRRVATNELYD